MANIGFLFVGVSDITGGGGAERFFSDFLHDYNKSGGKHKLLLIADKDSVKNFNAIGKFFGDKNVRPFKLAHNRFKNVLEFLRVLKIIVLNNIKIIQVPLYGIQYFEILKRIDKLPAFIRPKIVITIVDSFIPHYYYDENDKLYNYKKMFGPLFEQVRIDAVVSWYELFAKFAAETKVIRSNPPVYVIKSRYSGKKFPGNPQKKRQIMYASRLTPAKKPLMFVEAVSLLKQRGTEIKNWKCYIYGKGVLENEIQNKVKEYGLEDVFVLTHHHDLTEPFSESMCFVSTQDFENFPSLSMNEAMAAGNAIIARDVGQTSWFVKDGVNGILLKKDNAEGLADALEKFITNPELHVKMGKESVRLTKEVHTFENFKCQMEEFWGKILNA